LRDATSNADGFLLSFDPVEGTIAAGAVHRGASTVFFDHSIAVGAAREYSQSSLHPVLEGALKEVGICKERSQVFRHFRHLHGADLAFVNIAGLRINRSRLVTDQDISGCCVFSYLFASLVDVNVASAVLAVTRIAAGALLVRVFIVHQSRDGNLTAVGAVVESRIVDFEFHGVHNASELFKSRKTGDSLELRL